MPCRDALMNLFRLSILPHTIASALIKSIYHARNLGKAITVVAVAGIELSLIESHRVRSSPCETKVSCNIGIAAGG